MSNEELFEADFLVRKDPRGMLGLRGLWVCPAVAVTLANQEPKDPMVSKARQVLRVQQVGQETRVCRDQPDLLALMESPEKRESLEYQVQLV
ncbi:hypothetical protein MTO96_021691 [Rhipicephalus appendiculatus]